MTIPMSFWAIGMLRESMEWAVSCLKRQAVHDAGQRWCDESLTAAASGTGAWARGLDSCRLHHYGYMRGGPPIWRAAFLASLASVLNSLQLEELHAYENSLLMMKTIAVT